MRVKDIKTLAYNPFWCANLIPHFLSGAEDNKQSFEMLFLLFPFVLYKETRAILDKSVSSSNIYSAFLDNSSGRESQAGLDKRYHQFKCLTQQAILVASKEKLISLGPLVSLESKADYRLEKDPFIKEFYKASKYLGVILAKESSLDLFVKLGIKEI